MKTLTDPSYRAYMWCNGTATLWCLTLKLLISITCRLQNHYSTGDCTVKCQIRGSKYLDCYSKQIKKLHKKV